MKIYTTAFNQAFRRNFQPGTRYYGIYSLMWERFAESELRSLGYNPDDYELYHQAVWEPESVTDNNDQPIADDEQRRILAALHNHIDDGGWIDLAREKGE